MAGMPKPRVRAAAVERSRRVATRVMTADRRLFVALRIRNYRWYFAGQAVSLIGTWMQSVALSWLALELSRSGTIIGLVVAVQFLPVLLFGAYGGLVADRLPKRRVLIFTQSALAALALLLGSLSLAGVVELWMVFAIAGAIGLVLAVDNPTRQAFVVEMVGADRVRNAVGLNSALVNASRAVGPALAGGLIATVGLGICFIANAASFLAVLTALVVMHPQELLPAPVERRHHGQVREGLRYVRATPELLGPLLMMALIGTLAYEFPVVLPLLAHRTFGGGAPTFGWLTATMGLGAVVGGLGVAAAGRTGLRPLTTAAFCFGLAILVAAAAPSLAAELVALLLVGVASTAFMATGNSTLQLARAPAVRGRVMALWAVTFLGSTAIGGPAIGFISQHGGPRWGLAVGGAACLAATVLGQRACSKASIRSAAASSS